jgi:hypothetical protein
MAGFFSVPNFPVFLVPKMFVLFPASILLFILPISEILFPMVFIISPLAGLSYRKDLGDEQARHSAVEAMR